MAEKDTNIKEDISSDAVENVPVVDMSGTKVPGATNVSEHRNAENEHKAKDFKEVKVRLLKSHTHEGIEFEAGDIIDVDEASADYIVSQESGVKV